MSDQDSAHCQLSVASISYCATDTEEYQGSMSAMDIGHSPPLSSTSSSFSDTATDVAAPLTDQLRAISKGGSAVPVDSDTDSESIHMSISQREGGESAVRFPLQFDLESLEKVRTNGAFELTQSNKALPPPQEQGRRLKNVFRMIKKIILWIIDSTTF